MGEPDTRRWSLRDPSGAVRNANVPTALLVRWAGQGAILPGFAISADGETWVPAETLPDLGMTWYVHAPGHPPYGPVARSAAERLLAEGRFPKGATLSQEVGGQPASAELPLVIEATASALVIRFPWKRISSFIEPEPSISRMKAVRCVRVMLWVYMVSSAYYFRPRTA